MEAIADFLVGPCKDRQARAIFAGAGPAYPWQSISSLPKEGSGTVLRRYTLDGLHFQLSLFCFLHLFTSWSNYTSCVLLRHGIDVFFHFTQTVSILVCLGRLCKQAKKGAASNLGALPATYLGVQGMDVDALLVPALPRAMYRNRKVDGSVSGVSARPLSIEDSSRSPRRAKSPNEHAPKVIPFCGWVRNAHAS